MGPRPLIPQGSFQIDGMYQHHPEECGVHILGGGKAICVRFPQALARDHQIILPLGPDVDRAR